MAKKDSSPPARPSRSSKQPATTPPRRSTSKAKASSAPAKRASGKEKPAAKGKQAPPEPISSRRRSLLKIIAVLMFVLVAVAVIDPALLDGLWRGNNADQTVTNSDAPLASFYDPAVLHWEPQIVAWAKTYGVNPNVIAIVMQIESCGDPSAISGAGALGLMQVMPFHFDDGENMLNPDTNVRRGMNVFHECLQQYAGWDVGLAMACYNGGPSVTVRPQENWVRETQAYYRWATGLWNEVINGDEGSETLSQWLDAGGQALCTSASRRLSND